MPVFIADEQARSVDLDRLRRLAEHVLADRGVPAGMEVSVLCLDRGAMAELNQRHMAADGPTDVLAFPMDLPGETPAGEPAILGDVVLCPDVAAAQADSASVEPELDLLLVHGLLHLLGYDHVDESERQEMFGLTDRLLAGFHQAARSGADTTGADPPSPSEEKR